MNMKKLSKIISVLLVAFMMISIVTPVLAVGPSPEAYDGSGATTDVSKINDLGQNVISIVATVGSIISVVVLVVLGIKYMMGSAEEKAEYKKTLLPYIIGAALVFAASTVATVIFNFASSI